MRITSGAYKHIISLVFPPASAVAQNRIVHKELEKATKIYYM